MNDKPIYEVVSTHEVPELSKIKKSNISVEITLADSIRNMEQNQKSITAIEAEIKLKKALIENVKHNYPAVVDIEEKMQIACHTYYEANRYVKVAEEKLVEFNKAQEELKEEISAIEAQTGISKLSPERAAEIQANIKKIIEEDPGIINPK